MQINTPLCKMNGRDWSPEPGLPQALGLTFTKGLNLSLLEFSPNGAPPERKRNPGLCARAATAASRAALRPSARQRVHLHSGVRPQPRPVRNALPGAPATDGDTEARAVVGGREVRPRVSCAWSRGPVRCLHHPSVPVLRCECTWNWHVAFKSTRLLGSEQRAGQVSVHVSSSASAWSW